MEKEQLKVFSERLTKLRQKKELTQQQLGEILQIPRVSITRYETAERTPTVDHLVQFAQFFNVPSDYLLGLSDIESYNTDVQTIFRYTGLTANAIERLNCLSHTNGNFYPLKELSLIIDTSDFQEFIDIIKKISEIKKRGESNRSTSSLSEILNSFALPQELSKDEREQRDNEINAQIFLEDCGYIVIQGDHDILDYYQQKAFSTLLNAFHNAYGINFNF